MCGIAGLVSNRKDKEKIIKKMLKKIEHRGPDGEGIFIEDEYVLGHRRLSIIDLDKGFQPMYNEDKKIVIVFNGEIYNYKELKKELIKKGHEFKTESDTEVIIHGYEEYNEGILERIRGMFAFAIYDKNREKLFVARDHFGIKPLYYYRKDNELIFASEIKAFIDNPIFKKELNKDVLNEYLRFNYIPTNETFFKGVYELKPGHYLTFWHHKLNVVRYYEPTFDVIKEDYNKIVEKIGKTMEDSVLKHQISDVEVGSFLSSGIDSSYLVSLAKPDKTYTVGYNIEKYSEIEYAKDLACKLKINNTSKIITKEEYFKVIPKIMYHMDQPLADPAAIALYFVAELASRDVKVVLSGEGADEFFGGYNSYRRNVDFSWYNKIPYPIRYLIGSFCKLLPEVKGINFLVRRGRKVEDEYYGVNKVFTERETKSILKYKGSFKPNFEITEPIYNKHKKQNEINKMQAIDINLWLVKDILQKGDKMTMAHSIESRVPFTDIEVFNLARTLPYEAKVTRENTKIALRDAAKKVIPTEAYKKKKLGFPVPLREWMMDDDVYNIIKKSFDMDICKELFKTKKLNKLLDEHKSGKKDNYKKIWTVYCFLVWYKEFFV